VLSFQGHLRVIRIINSPFLQARNYCRDFCYVCTSWTLSYN